MAGDDATNVSYVQPFLNTRTHDNEKEEKGNHYHSFRAKSGRIYWIFQQHMYMHRGLYGQLSERRRKRTHSLGWISYLKPVIVVLSVCIHMSVRV